VGNENIFPSSHFTSRNINTLWKIKAFKSEAQTGSELREMSTDVDNKIWPEHTVIGLFVVYQDRKKKRIRWNNVAGI
jgi:hypothetical protein